ncbi:MAG: CRTAC1 family protein, partial [Acidobacteriota bacterium]|nr:CRTAC1 family protein [Acidobacteriota bacterium]
GDLDLYIGNEIEAPGTPYPSQLFRNNGDGTFTDVATMAGVRNDRMAKAVAWGDYDNDGDPDLYVSNIGPNRLYRNNGDGTFTDVAADAGVTEPAGRSFPAWFFDYDNDGFLDIFVADYGASLTEVALGFLGQETGRSHPRLYRNLGRGRFRDVSRDVGLTAASLPMGSNYGDLDNDGFLDFYLGVGTPSYESIAPNLMYRNDRGRRFQDVTYSGGFGHLQKGHGVAFGDIDNDGDQDLFEQMGGAYPGDAYPSVLYRNPGHGRAWVTLGLTGVESNRSAFGARVRVSVQTENGPRDIRVVVGTGGSFGGSSVQQEIGLDDAASIREIEIRWPASGRTQVFRDVEPNRFYEVREDRDELVAVERASFTIGPP